MEYFGLRKVGAADMSVINFEAISSKSVQRSDQGATLNRESLLGEPP
jgi:hypothetical protein